ncbi:MAG: hypothetical protein AAF226_01655, partial [Verrucomicrobiota bacterium]
MRIGHTLGLGLAVCCLLLFGLATDASAQINMKLDMDRTSYLKHEPISGKLIIVNRSGRDLVFGNTNGESWLDFTVQGSSGY